MNVRQIEIQKLPGRLIGELVLTRCTPFFQHRDGLLSQVLLQLLRQQVDLFSSIGEVGSDGVQLMLCQLVEFAFQIKSSDREPLVGILFVRRPMQHFIQRLGGNGTGGHPKRPQIIHRRHFDVGRVEFVDLLHDVYLLAVRNKRHPSVAESVPGSRVDLSGNLVNPSVAAPLFRWQRKDFRRTQIDVQILVLHPQSRRKETDSPRLLHHINGQVRRFVWIRTGHFRPDRIQQNRLLPFQDRAVLQSDLTSRQSGTPQHAAAVPQNAKARSNQLAAHELTWTHC